MKDYVETGDNIFAHLGLSNPEERLAKVKLAMQIDETIRKKRLTQGQAAKILGVSETKILALLSGKLAAFSIDCLFTFLMDLAKDIEIRIKSKLDKTKILS